MAISCEPDLDALISELAASLTPAARAAFEAAARSALVAAGCSGSGAAYRVLAPLQRGYWDPPADDRLAHSGARHQRSSKLADGPPLDEDSARGRASTAAVGCGGGGDELLGLCANGAGARVGGRAFLAAGWLRPDLPTPIAGCSPEKRCDGWLDFIALTCILDKQAQAENPSRILHFSRIGFGSSGVSRVDE